nr:hypothetical protein [Tanacetum cinerariifolium]
MSTLAEFMILSGADNRPPMLEKHLYDSWKSKMELHMKNRKHGRMILESVEHGPLIWPTIKENDDPIDAINKMMSFLSTAVSSRFPTTNNQLKDSSNPRQQATIHDGMVIVQPVQRRQSSFAAGHMARQYPKPKRKRDATWFRDKVLLVEAQGFGKVLNEEELEFLAYPRVAKGLVTQTVITHNAAYQADDLDAYDSDCDDFYIAKAVLMANLSSYGSDVLFEVPHSKITHNDTLNQNVQEM